MILRSLEEPLELIVLKWLNTRMELASNFKQRYLNLLKGFEGEKRFNALLSKYNYDWLIINSLLLEYNDSTFQIDNLIITQNTIFQCEIKNGEGEYYIEDNKWYTCYGKDSKNPILQLERSNNLLQCIFKELRIHITKESYLFFVNPEFTLLQAPRKSPIVLPTQLNRFIKEICTKPSKLSSIHHTIADKIISLHIENNPFKRIPPYRFETLKKGMNCETCCSLGTIIKEKKLICLDCGNIEPLEQAVLRSVKQFKVLFPDKNITVNSIYEWCGIVKSKKTIRRILSKHYILVVCSRNSYYKEK